MSVSAHHSPQGPLPSERAPVLRAISGLSTLAGVLAALCLLAAIALIFSDLLSRNLAGRSIAGVTEMSSWLMAGLGWLALSHTLRHEGHIQVRIVADRLPESAQRVLAIVTSSVALAFMAALVWAMVDRWQFFRETGQRGVETGYPTWWLYTVVLVGAALFTLQFLARLVDDVALWRRHRRSRRDANTS